MTDLLGRPRWLSLPSQPPFETNLPDTPGEAVPMSSATPMTFTSYEVPPERPEVAIANNASELLAYVVPSQAARPAIKRIMDVVGAFLGLVFLSPFLFVIAVLIRLDSPGPILFCQRRVGLRGREFFCLKFRTMVADAEARLRDLEARNESAGGVLFKIKNDPRVTPLGRFLRRSSLDEVPQLWNVLRGEMSLVGPRPLQIRDSEKLEQFDAEGYHRRLSVFPGVTGPWQVGGRSEVDSARMLELDLQYVGHWSIATDLVILVKTVAVVLAGRGAC